MFCPSSLGVALEWLNRCTARDRGRRQKKVEGMPFGCAPMFQSLCRGTLSCSMVQPWILPNFLYTFHLLWRKHHTAHPGWPRQTRHLPRRVLPSLASRAREICGQESQLLEPVWDPADQVKHPAHMFFVFLLARFLYVHFFRKMEDILDGFETFSWMY